VALSFPLFSWFLLRAFSGPASNKQRGLPLSVCLQVFIFFAILSFLRILATPERFGFFPPQHLRRLFRLVLLPFPLPRVTLNFSYQILSLLSFPVCILLDVERVRRLRHRISGFSCLMSVPHDPLDNDRPSLWLPPFGSAPQLVVNYPSLSPNTLVDRRNALLGTFRLEDLTFPLT